MVSSRLLQAQAQLEARRNSEQWTANSELFAETLTPDPSPSGRGEIVQWQRPKFTLEVVKDESTDCSLPPINDWPVHCPLSTNILIHGEMASAVLRVGYVGAARIWWLLHAIDNDGRGVVEKAVAKEQLAGNVGGWRRIRQLLCEGDGLFWQWDGERVWLRSLVKVAAELGIRRFSADPVPFPTEKLFGRIAQVKANLYAIFHSSRAETPIARATLQSITGISPSSQRTYEENVGINAQPQFALLTDNITDAAWKHGRAAFVFTDHLGKHGRRGQQWTARQLPNCYTASFNQQTNKRGRLRLNRKLADLLQQGTTGNDWQTFEQVYYAKDAMMNGQGYFQTTNGMWFRC